MQFSDEALNQLRDIYREEFNLEISRDQAAEIGTRIVDLLGLLLRPLPREDEREKPSDL